MQGGTVAPPVKQGKGTRMATIKTMAQMTSEERLALSQEQISAILAEL